MPFLKRFRSYLQLAVATGLVVIRNRDLRRRLMFWLAISAMGVVLLGITVLDAGLSESAVFLAAYWGFCLVLVILMFLLALYDMLAVSREIRSSEAKKPNNDVDDS